MLWCHCKKKKKRIKNSVLLSPLCYYKAMHVNNKIYRKPILIDCRETRCNFSVISVTWFHL